MRAPPHRLLAAAVLIACVLGQPDYSDKHTLECSQINSSQTEIQANLNQLWPVLVLHKIDRFCFLAVCPVLLVLQVLFLMVYRHHPQLLAKPGNIYCGLVVIELALNLHLFANAIYRTLFPGELMPDSFTGFCIGSGLFSSFFTIVHFMYLILFMFYTIFLFRFTLKKKSELFWTMLHVFVVVSSLSLTVFFYLWEFMGLNFYGMCGMTATRKMPNNPIVPGVEIVSSIFFAMLGLFTYLYFKKHMPGGGSFKKKKLEETKIIAMYVIGFSLIEILMSVMSLLIQLNCLQDHPLPQLTVLTSIVNVFRLLEYAFLLFLIMFNHRFRAKFKHTIKGFFQKAPQEQQLKHLRQAFQIEDVLFHENLLELKDEANEIDLLLLSQVYTIVSGIYIAYYEYFREPVQHESIRRIHFRENVSFGINSESIRDYETEARQMIKLKILSCTIVLHSPKIFHRLVQNDCLHEIYKSFKIIQNSRKLVNLVEGNGGKSGEFFFFSFDNKYVIKTINEDEFSFYRENLEIFYEYYKNNNNSLLSKILGLFTIRGDEMQRTYYMIVMKNMLGCNSEQILKIYDLKGSTYDRQVMPQEQINQVYKQTLKDVNFINDERKIKIALRKAEQLRQALQKDTLFLKSLNLIDYSLLVVRVKWNQRPGEAHFWGQLQRIPHESQKNQFYHIGIIDYMQKWDMQKRGEKWWKSLTGKKDVSAQEPKLYQQRFIKFVEEITRPADDQASCQDAVELTEVKEERLHQYLPVQAQKYQRDVSFAKMQS